MIKYQKGGPFDPHQVYDWEIGKPVPPGTQAEIIMNFGWAKYPPNFRGSWNSVYCGGTSITEEIIEQICEIYNIPSPYPSNLNIKDYL